MTRKSTKSALFTSCIALLLCFTMLLGTTFAWFTDSVTSANNIIKSGNLDVEFEYWNGKDWADVKAASDILTNTLWEPGVTEVAYLKVANAGSLALKYQLGINIVSELAGKNVAGDEFKLSDYLYFGVIEGAKENAYANRADAVAAVTNAQLISAGYTKEATIEAGSADNYFALVVYMPETVDNVANHNGTDVPEIALGLNVFATQLAAEEDSFGKDYDEFAGLPWDGTTVTDNLTADAEGVYHITSAADLVAMMNDSKYPDCNKYQNVVLESDINLGGKTISGFGDDAGFFDGIFDGQGYTISNFKIDASNRTYYAGLFNQVSQYSGTNTVIKNLTVANATVIGSGQVGVIAGGMNGNTVVDNCKVINSTVTGVKKVGAVVGYTAGGTVTNNYAENCKVYYTEKEGEEILGYENTGSTVSGNTAKNVTVEKVAEADSQDEFTAAVTGGAGLIELAAGNYKMPSASTKGDMNIVGTKDTVIDVTHGAYLESANVTFDGVTIKTSTGMANGNGSDYAALYSKDITYKNCTFVGPMRLGRDGAKFINCTFTSIGDNYIWTNGNDATFEGCTFNTDGKAILVYSDGGNEIAKLSVKNCKFNATKGAKAGAIANQNCAAIEIHNYGHGVNLVTEGNSFDSNFSGEWRIKTYETGKSGITVNGVEYKTIAIDGKLMTIDANRNVTIQ